MEATSAAAIHSATSLIPALHASINDGARASTAALACTRTHRRADRMRHPRLALARARRAEGLLAAAEDARATATRDARAALAAVCVSEARGGGGGGAATWGAPADGWWEERRIGLRWRLGCILDALVFEDVDGEGEIGVERTGDEDDADAGECEDGLSYLRAVMVVAERWRVVERLAAELDTWTATWMDVARLVLAGSIGDTGVLTRV